MNNDTIKLEWIKRSRQYSKHINRQKFMDEMQKIKTENADDNEISSKFVETIPEIASIRINYDVNATKKSPSITYKTIDGKKETMTIIRHHKIIWGKLEEYCS